MGKWLASIAKGLSYSAGQFKPAVDLLLKLYDGELAERADNILQKMILEQKDTLSKQGDTLAEIARILREIRQSNGVSGQQLANGTEAVVGLIQSGRMTVTSPEQLEDLLKGKLVDNNVTTFWQKSFVCLSTVEQECIELYGNDVERFRVLVEGGGFKTAALPAGDASDVTIRKCLRQTLTTRRYAPAVQASIIGELSKDAEGSAILKAAHQLLLLALPGNGKA